MSLDSNEQYQLAKAQITQTTKLMKSKPARNYMAKKQMERAGVGNGYYRTQARGPSGEDPGQVKKADGYIRTIHDMIDYYYGFVPEYTQKEAGGGGAMSKQDNALMSGDDGYRNVVYGSEVFSLLNSEANVFSLLESRAWVKSGERIVTERAAGGNHTLGSGGLDENAALPDTDHPDISEFEQDPKTIAHNFDVSQEKALLAETEDDDIEDPFDWLRRWYGTGTEHQTGQGEHPKHINVQMVTDADTPAGNNMESVDRVLSNGAESDILSDPSDNDVYGFDRSNNEFESNVIENGGNNQTFVLDTLDDMVREIKENSGKRPVSDDNYFFLTGHDTYQRIEDEVGGKERLEPVRTAVGLNGVQSNPGGDVGLTVQSYKGIPIFESIDVPSDGISRVYLIDSSTLFTKILLPTQFYSTGTEVDENPFGINRLGNEGMYVTIGELTCTNPAAHAKARDLQ
jgi:hypothetical protein